MYLRISTYTVGRWIGSNIQHFWHFGFCQPPTQSTNIWRVGNKTALSTVLQVRPLIQSSLISYKTKHSNLLDSVSYLDLRQIVLTYRYQPPKYTWFNNLINKSLIKKLHLAVLKNVRKNNPDPHQKLIRVDNGLRTIVHPRFVEISHCVFCWQTNQPNN